ncbi:MAG: adaptor protein MecA [Clostridia bacterium]|nr:adaptor protein MecA [Clostridia bacterium]
MKVEKLSDSKVRITLTFEELEKRKITLNDIEKDSTIAKELFVDLLEESDLDNDFVIDDSHLFIEASSDNNNLFVVTITKVEDLPDLKKYSLTDVKGVHSTKKSLNSNTKYTVDSNIYSFQNIDNILTICEKAKSEKLFFGKNSLYKLEDVYYLVFSKSSIKNSKFLKTYVFLSEFCNDYYSYDLYETCIKEKAKLIIENNALQKLKLI